MNPSRILIVALSLTVIIQSPVAAAAAAADVGPGTVQLLDGYVHKARAGRDTHVGTITRADGKLTLNYEIGRMAGASMGPERKNDCAWYREQTIGGRKVCAGLIKNGDGQQLLVTVHLPDAEVAGGRNYPANFMANVSNDQDVADVLLTAVTYTGDR